MVDHSLHAFFKHVCLAADRPQQAVPHFAHDGFGATLLALVFTCTQVDACSAYQPVRISCDVRIKTFELIRQAGDMAQAPFIGLRHCVCKQCFYFVAQLVNFLMGKGRHVFLLLIQWVYPAGGGL